MRLTPDLLLQCPQYLNAIKQWQLDCRGLRIPAIENLGVTRDQFECMDFSNNDIKKLGNFPALHRLDTLLLHSNRIFSISFGLGRCLPRLETLMLTNNKISHLSDIDPLAEITSIRVLSLIDNPITRRQNYRLYVIYKLPHLKYLDFRKVKQQEREEAHRLFSGNLPEETKTFEPGEVTEENGGLSTVQIDRIKRALISAKTLDQVNQLDLALKEGIMPDERLLIELESGTSQAEITPSKSELDESASKRNDMQDENKTHEDIPTNEQEEQEEKSNEKNADNIDADNADAENGENEENEDTQDMQDTDNSAELDLSSMRVVDLKKELSERGLPQSGVKKVLIARLQEAIDNEKKQ